MNGLSRPACCLLVVLTVLYVGSAYADPVKWTLTPFDLDDGGRVSGSFVYDADTGLYSDILFETTPGTTFPGGTYTVLAYDHSSCLPAACSGRLIQMLQAFPARDGDIKLGLSGFDPILSDAGGTIEILAGNAAEQTCTGVVNGECRFSGIPQRRALDSVFLTAGPVDEETVFGNGFEAMEVYDLKLDWSDTVNPNGVWSYTGDDGELLTISQSNWDPSGTFFSTQPAWADATFPGAGHVPMWLNVSGASSVDASGVVMHGSEGSNEAWVGVEWQSPQDGKIHVEGAVWQALKVEDDGVGGNHRNRNSDWRLRLENTVLASGNVSGTDGFTSGLPASLASGAGGNSPTGIDVSTGDRLMLEFISPTSFATFDGAELTITGD